MLSSHESTSAELGAIAVTFSLSIFVLADAEKGCHVLHILSAVRQRHSLNVSKAALELVLKSLECSSDIVSMSENHYTMF